MLDHNDITERRTLASSGKANSKKSLLIDSNQIPNRDSSLETLLDVEITGWFVEHIPEILNTFSILGTERTKHLHVLLLDTDYGDSETLQFSTRQFFDVTVQELQQI